MSRRLARRHVQRNGSTLTSTSPRVVTTVESVNAALSAGES
jgi:hypothetical protein